MQLKKTIKCNLEPYALKNKDHKYHILKNEPIFPIKDSINE